MCCRKNKLEGELEFGKKLENIAFITALVIVIALFSLPIIFYYTSNTIEASNSNTSNNYSAVYNTGGINNCTNISWSRDDVQDDASKCFEYTGTFCKDFLNQWFQCAVGKGNLTVEITREMQIQQETTIGNLNNYLVYYPQCQQASLPFICQYFFPLADCATGNTYTATREDCVAISTGVCAELWAIATRLGYASLLPDCYSLPNAANDSYSMANNSSMTIHSNETNGLPCRKDFIKSNLICEPRCDSFEQSSHSNTLVMIYTEVTTTSIALAISLITVIFAIKEYKKMLTYPTILVFFIVIDMIVLEIALIITACDRNGLYCSSASLLETLDNPAPFCKLSGAVFQYCIVNMVLWWFFYGTIFFHKVLFPFKAERLKSLGYNKYIFATAVILSLLLPLPAVIVSLSVDQFKYNIYRFPTTLCISSGNMWFYSTTLPMDILLAVGTVMLITIFWSIRKSSRVLKMKGNAKLSTAERKIILVFTSFIVLGVFILGNTSGATAKANQFQAALAEYFECEALGHIPGKCDRGTFENIYNPYTNAISYILMGLVPLSLLNFIIKWSTCKGTRNRLSQRYSSFLLNRMSSMETSSDNTPESPGFKCSHADKSENSNV